MESAIPSHLTTARSRHRRVPDDYRPPYPSFVARHKPTVSHIVLAYFGCSAAFRRGTCRAEARRYVPD